MAATKRFEGEEISSAYSRFRPVYPAQVVKTITSFMRAEGSSGFDTALDVACGSGQSTFLLSNSFRKVIGLDISQTQINEAKNRKETDQGLNVQFMVGDAHNLPVETSSIDLLTCAMGWHWLDADLFYAEAKRVLKPRGCLAVYGHGVKILDNQRIRNALDQCRAEYIRSDCLPEQNLHVMNDYASVSLPFRRSKRFELDFTQETTFEGVLGFISSISMYKTYCEKYPENTLLQKVRANYEADVDICDVEKFTFPGFIIVGLNE